MLHGVSDVTWEPIGAEASLGASSPTPPTTQPAAVGVAAPSRQKRVRDAMVHAWAGYKRHAWGTDELEPAQQRGVSSYGMGLTLVDSLDTLLVMGLDADAAQAIGWIEHSLTFGSQEEINVFEVTIRVLGQRHRTDGSLSSRIVC